MQIFMFPSLLSPLLSSSSATSPLTVFAPMPHRTITSSGNDVISLSNEQLVLNWARHLGITYRFQKGELREYEKSLYIAPVAALYTPGHGKVYGVFANCNIPKGEYIAVYSGEKKQDVEDIEDTDYVYHLPDSDWCIDARLERGVAGFVNSVLDQDLANIESIAIGEGKEGEIFYVTTKPIKRGEQILGCYGPGYQFDERSFRFLSPSHNYRDSSDLWVHNVLEYAPTPIILDPLFLSLFYRSVYTPQHYWKVSSFLDGSEESTLTAENLDLPFLELSSLGVQHYVPQNQSEGITSLMSLIWVGQVDNVLRFLKKGANPSIQSLLTGISCLHILMKTPRMSPENKMAVLNELKKMKVFFYPQDVQGRWPLHDAIAAQQDWSIVHFLIQQMQSAFVRNNEHGEREYALIDDGESRILSIFAPTPKQPGLVTFALRAFDANEKKEEYAEIVARTYFQELIKNLLDMMEPEDWKGLLAQEDARAILINYGELEEIVRQAFVDLYHPVHMTQRLRVELKVLAEKIEDFSEQLALKSRKKSARKLEAQSDIHSHYPPQAQWLSGLITLVQQSDCFDPQGAERAKATVSKKTPSTTALTFSHKRITRQSAYPDTSSARKRSTRSSG